MPDFSQEELLAEAKRRGLDVSQYEQPAPQYRRDELLAEAKRRGLDVSQFEPKQSMLDKAWKGAEWVGDKSLDLINAEGSLAQGALQGVAQIPKGLHNLNARLSNALLGTDIHEITGKDSVGGVYNELAGRLGLPQIPREVINKDPRQRTESPAAYTAGDIASYFTPMGASRVGLRLLSPGASMLERAAAKVGDNAITGAGYGALYGASNNDEDLVNSALKSALIGGIGGSALEGVLKAPSAYITNKVQKIASKAAPGYVKSPQEAAAAYEKIEPLLGDAKIDLGSLIGDIPLSRKYNEKLRHTLGAGGMIADNQQQLIGNANREVNDLLGGLLGKTTDRNVHDEIVNRLQAIKDANAKSSREGFNGISQEADARGFDFPGWDKAKVYAKQILRDEDKILGSGLKGELKSLIENVGKEVQAKEGRPANNYSYSDAHFSHSNVGRLADELAAKQKYRAADIANKLQENIREDIQNALTKSGNKDLYDRWVQERKNFATNVVPFRKKSLTQILAGDKDSSKISDEILASKNKDILPHLNQDLKNLTGYAQFSDLVKDNGASLQKVVNRFQTLDRNKDLDILEPQVADRFRALSTLNNMLPEAKLATNPGGTGIRNYANLSNAIKGAITGGAALHNPFLAIGGGVATVGSENALARALTSEKLRNAYINQGIKPPKNVEQMKNALIRALANYNSEGTR